MDTLLALIGDQWTLGIIHKLTTGPWRSVELHSSFKGMSTKTLSSRLNRLARHNLVVRKSYPERPPRVEYSLTEKGRELLPVLDEIAALAHRWFGTEPVDGVSAGCPACRADSNRYASVSDVRDNSAFREESKPLKRPQSKKRTDVTLL